MHDLGELEDLYYAACDKLKELLDTVEIFLANKFRAPEDEYFTFNSKSLEILGLIKVVEFKNGRLM